MTFYEVLEIDPRASTAEIERVFRKLARTVHPDVNSGDPRGAEARMKLLNEIRDTLTDPLRRAVYDAELLNEAAARARETPRAEDAEPVAAVHDETTSSQRGETSWAKRIWLAVGVGTISAAVFVAAHPNKYDTTPTQMPAAPAPPPVPLPAPRRTVAPTTTTTSPPSPSAPAPAPARWRPAGRAVVHIGTRADEVIRKLGSPDRVDPGARSGDAVFHYGHLRLEIKNGRVARGDAAD